MNALRNYAATGLITLYAFVGCQIPPDPIVEMAMPEANGYDVSVEYLGKRKPSAVIKIGDYDTVTEAFPGSVIYAIDIDGDGRVDKIRLQAPKGSPLEKLACVEKIGGILGKIEENNR